VRALILKEKSKPLTVEEVKNPAGEIIVQLSHAALNHRDVWIQKGMYAAIEYPAILGSDGVGKVILDGDWKGKEIIINPNINWGDSQHHQSKTYQVLGMPSQGTFAEQISLRADRLVEKPSHLSNEEAAALPLSGLTAYRALFKRANASSNDKVLINGVGGGVALFACQFAIAAGCEVYVTSSKQEKIDAAVALGAKAGFNYKEDDWVTKAKAVGGFDVIIDSAGGEGFKNLVKVSKSGARIAFYGGTHGNISINPQVVFWKQISILGSTMGSDVDFNEMVNFVNHHKIKPVVDSVYKLADGQAAFDKMAAGKQFGKIVLEI